MRSLNCLLVQNAHLARVLSKCSATMCLFIQQKSLAVSLDRHSDLILVSISYTMVHNPHKHLQSLSSPHPIVLSSSCRCCHSVTSSTGQAASQWCPPLEPEISFSRAHPVTVLCHSGAQTGGTARMTARE